MHMLHRTALPAAAGSSAVAVNALPLSSSPWKTREHTGPGCARRSAPRGGGRGGCGVDGLAPLGRTGLCVGASELATERPPFPGLPSHHCRVPTFGSVEGFYWYGLYKGRVASKGSTHEGYLIRDCTN